MLPFISVTHVFGGVFTGALISHTRPLCCTRRGGAVAVPHSLTLFAMVMALWVASDSSCEGDR